MSTATGQRATALYELAEAAEAMAEDDGTVERAFCNLALALVIHHRDVVSTDTIRAAVALWATDGVGHAFARMLSEVDYAAMQLAVGDGQ